MGTFPDDSNYDTDFTSVRNPLKRLYGQGGLHFITFSCYHRLPFLGTPQSRDCFIRLLDIVRTRHQFHLFGYVVMPEHVHLLIDEPPKVTPSTVLQVLKQKVSSELAELRASCKLDKKPHPNAQTPDEPPFWQRRFYDFNVWRPNKIKEKLNYMHANPVSRGLVAHPNDWAWSSWLHNETGKAGLIRIDLLSEAKLEGGKFGGARQGQNPHP